MRRTHNVSHVYWSVLCSLCQCSMGCRPDVASMQRHIKQPPAPIQYNDVLLLRRWRPQSSSSGCHSSSTAEANCRRVLWLCLLSSSAYANEALLQFCAPWIGPRMLLAAGCAHAPTKQHSDNALLLRPATGPYRAAAMARTAARRQAPERRRPACPTLCLSRVARQARTHKKYQSRST